MTDVQEPYDPPDTEELLLRARDQLETARSVPMSASVMVNRDDLLVLVDDAIAGLPEELRQARWLLKEREEFLAKARREAEDIIDAGRAQAERMVERTEVVREARRRAQQVVDDAEAQARAPEARGRGLHRPEAGVLRGGARPHDAGGPEGSGAAPGRRRPPGGRGGPRRRRGRVLRPGRGLTGSALARPGKCSPCYNCWSRPSRADSIVSTGLKEP